MGLSRRAGTAAVAAFASAAALLVITFSFVSAAQAAVIKDRGAPPPPVLQPLTKADGSPATVGETLASPAAAERFWTPERMRSAEPAEVRQDPAHALDLPSFGGDASTSAATGDFVPGNVTAYPQRIHGKIFFRVGASTYSCSGTVIESRLRNVVFTAGHCVFDQETKSFVTDLVFIPGYENGQAPLGFYGGAYLLTTAQWVTSGDMSYDIGVVQLSDPIQTQFGSRKIAFDVKPNGREYTLFGYPSQPSNLFNGETLRGCNSRIEVRDDSKSSPFPIGAAPCLMQQGSSGGGWVTLGNYVNSVVSYGYCDQVPNLCGLIFGPYFSNAAMGLYADKTIGGSPAPTVKVKQAPPKVVRKRKVSFTFGGSAATLLGFECKLDRQRKVGCSSKISITRLSAGKHTLRVRAIDQTGKRSKKQIVRSFRVALR